MKGGSPGSRFQLPTCNISRFLSSSNTCPEARVRTEKEDCIRQLLQRVPSRCEPDDTGYDDQDGEDEGPSIPTFVGEEPLHLFPHCEVIERRDNKPQPMAFPPRDGYAEDIRHGAGHEPDGHGKGGPHVSAVAFRVVDGRRRDASPKHAIEDNGCSEAYPCLGDVKELLDIGIHEDSGDNFSVGVRNAGQKERRAASERPSRNACRMSRGGLPLVTLPRSPPVTACVVTA